MAHAIITPKQLQLFTWTRGTQKAWCLSACQDPFPKYVVTRRYDMLGNITVNKSTLQRRKTIDAQCDGELHRLRKVTSDSCEDFRGPRYK